MLDKSTDDDKSWRQHVPTPQKARRYLGTHVTVSQWAYVAHNDQDYCLVFVHILFKQYTVTRVREVNAIDWSSLPNGEWVPIADTGWSRYEVYDE